MNDDGITPSESDTLRNEIIRRVVAMAYTQEEAWSDKHHNLLAFSYVLSLVKGDGTAPAGLWLDTAANIYKVFADCVGELGIAPGTYPGQRAGSPVRVLTVVN